MKRIALLGSTGSIGTNAIKVAQHLGPDYKIVALAAKGNIDLLELQANECQPELIAVYDKGKACELQRRLPKMRVVGGMEGINAVACYDSADMVISAMTGTIGLGPTIIAIQAGKTIGLANKEALVSGGALVMALAKQHNVPILPIDSEHSAIFQCLNGEKRSNAARIILTASGGPYRTYSAEQLKQVDVESALCHPNWKMGPKITIDCSTLMNKGLEVIEAHWLYGMSLDKIDVVIHPQSVIHSMVEFVDGSMMAQMSEPNMIVPIQYAMTYPERAPGLLPQFDFIKNGTLQFFAPDINKFRCLGLAYQAIKQGGTLPCYMNAANEVLVQRFLDLQISWMEIGSKLEQLMSQHNISKIRSLDDIFEADKRARAEALLV